VNNRAIGVGKFKYAIQVFKGGKGVAMATKFRAIHATNCSDFTSVQDTEKFYCVNSRFSASANSNMLSEFLGEQRVLPFQPNLAKNKPKL